MTDRPDVLTDARLPRWTRLDTVGAVLFVALAAWIVVAAELAGGNPWPMVVLVLGTGLAAFGARELTRRFGIIVPGVMVAVLLVIIALAWPQATHRLFGLLGYSNANGALYAIGTGAACLVVLRGTWLGPRIAGGIAALFLMVLPWLFGADAASGSAIVIVLVTVVLLLTGRPMNWIGSVAMVGAVAALIATIVAGIAYGGYGEGDGAGRLTERRLVLWNDATDIIRQAPVVGIGPGRFADFSPMAQRDRDASWAHHEPLSVGAEVGLPGMVLLLAIVAWAVVWLRRGTGRRGATLATVVLATAFAHATIDFVWHNPGVPLALGIVVGVGATAGYPTDRHLE